MKSVSSFSRTTMASMALRLLTFLASILLLATSLSAQTEVQADWILTGIGRYSVATNWSTGTVPNNDSSFIYNVAINQGTVNSDVDATINCLTIGIDGVLADHGPGVVSPSTLTAETMVNEGFVGYVAGGKLNISGVLINYGNFEMEDHHATATLGDTFNSGSLGTTAFGGEIIVNGTLTNTSTGRLHNPSVLTVNGDLINDGTVTTDFNGLVRISGDVSNSGAYTLNHDVISGVVQNEGTMSVFPAFGGSPLIGTFNNDGELRLPKGLSTTSFAQGSSGIWQEDSSPNGIFFGIVGATNTISLDGTLDVGPLASKNPVLGLAFDIATFPPGSLDGSFSAIVGNSFGSGQRMFQINYDNDAGHIRLTVVPAGSQQTVYTSRTR